MNSSNSKKKYKENYNISRSNFEKFFQEFFNYEFCVIKSTSSFPKSTKREWKLKKWKSLVRNIPPRNASRYIRENLFFAQINNHGLLVIMYTL